MTITELKSAVQLIRKRRLLEKLTFSKSTLHDLMKRDSSFPRAIYLTGSRIPLWREIEIDEWIALSAQRPRQAPPAKRSRPKQANVEGLSHVVYAAPQAMEVQPRR